MNKSTIGFDLSEDEIGVCEVSDEALEAAAGTSERASAITLAFCSGLDTCPA